MGPSGPLFDFFINLLAAQTTFQECLILREEVENLLLRCAEVRASAAQRKVALQELYDDVVACMRQASPPEGRQALDNAFAESRSLQRMQSNEFFAQLTRSDTPICASEVIPSLLSESVEMIRMYVSYLDKSDEGLDGAAIEEASKILGRAEKEGYPIADAEQKLQALYGQAQDAG